MADHERRAELAERAAREGASVAAEAFRTGIDVETKSGKTDVVTQADRDAQERVIEVVRERYPDDAVVGEEEDAAKRVPADGNAWVIDPIDGTSNYVRDVPIWATAVAAVVDGETVAAANVMPALGDAYVADADGVRHNGEDVGVSERTDPETFQVCPTMWWEYDDREAFAELCRGVVERFGDLRRYGSAQTTLAMVAAGQVEGALTDVRAHPWDAVGGVRMIRRAGGVVTDVHGDPWHPDARGLVASNGAAHDELLAAVADAR